MAEEIVLRLQIHFANELNEFAINVWLKLRVKVLLVDGLDLTCDLQRYPGFFRNIDRNMCAFDRSDPA